MADRPVRQTGKAQDGDITSLCNAGSDWSPRSKANAISDIENGTHTYHVPWQGGRTEIHVVNGATGKYPHTDADSSERNNLLDLPDC